MDITRIKPIQKIDTYIETALYRGRKATEELNQSRASTTRLDRIRRLESKRIEVIHDYIQEGLFIPVVTKFPNMEELPEFYKELIKVTIEYPQLKKSLGGVNWAWKQESELYRIHTKKMRSARDVDDIVRLRKAYMGRLVSIIKQIKSALDYIEQSRRVMKHYPIIKELKTVCIAGFPNVGKSTLLSKLTSAKPEINSYAFTTKQLNLGYIFSGKEPTLQLVDTPGTLNRLDKMNLIEKQAYIAMKYSADKIIYVFDLTEEYPVEQQIELYKSIRKLNKDMIAYASKADIMGQGVISDFATAQNLKIASLEELKQILKEMADETAKTAAISQGQ